MLASLPGFFRAGLAVGLRQHVSETWSGQPPACFASCSRPHKPASNLLLAPPQRRAGRPASRIFVLGCRNSDPPVLSALPRAMEQRRPQMTSSARAKASTPGLPQGPALDSPLVPWRTSFRHGIIIIIFREFCAPPGVEVTPALLGWGSTDQPGTHQPQAMTARTGATDPRDRPVCPV